MPQQIDRCASCSRPIYDADDVPGACACSEGIYHTLIARQREENHQGWRRTASAGIDQALSQSEPPTLDPSMFLSAAARRELAAAEQMRNIPRPVPGGPMRGRPSPMTDDPTDGFLDLDRSPKLAQS